MDRHTLSHRSLELLNLLDKLTSGTQVVCLQKQFSEPPFLPVELLGDRSPIKRFGVLGGSAGLIKCKGWHAHPMVHVYMKIGVQ